MSGLIKSLVDAPIKSFGVSPDQYIVWISKKNLIKHFKLDKDYKNKMPIQEVLDIVDKIGFGSTHFNLTDPKAFVLMGGITKTDTHFLFDMSFLNEGDFKTSEFVTVEVKPRKPAIITRPTGKLIPVFRFDSIKDLGIGFCIDLKSLFTCLGVDKKEKIISEKKYVEKIITFCREAFYCDSDVGLIKNPPGIDMYKSVLHIFKESKFATAFGKDQIKIRPHKWLEAGIRTEGGTPFRFSSSLLPNKNEAVCITLRTPFYDVDYHAIRKLYDNAVTERGAFANETRH